MKRIWNSIGKTAKDANYQGKAVKHVEDMEKGLKTKIAPKHASEEKHFEAAQKDDKIREEINKKYDSLVDNMNKMTIRSSDPPERWTSTKDLPTRESEFLHRHDPVWEYGFYEPELDRMPKEKIMLREAVEMLRRKQEMDVEGTSSVAVEMREKAINQLQEHVAYKRIGKEKLNLVYEYFRPFERKEEQKVVSRIELAKLQDALQGRSDEINLFEDGNTKMRQMLEAKGKEGGGTWMSTLSKKEQVQLEEAVKTLRSEEHERLARRLKEVNEMEKEFVESTRKEKEKEKKGNE